MARPQTERGFVMIACDLFAALSVADWPKREWTVLSEILLQVYGTQKRREAHVDPRLVEHYTGLSSKNVYRALRNLEECGVIARNANGSYRFIKDFEAWQYQAIEKATGSPARSRRLTDGDLRFALSANDRYGMVAPINKSKGVGIQPDTSGIQRDTVPSQKRYPTGYQNCAPTVSNGILPTGKQTASVDASNACESTGYVPPLACGGAPASEDLEIRDIKTPLPPNGGDDGDDSFDAPEDPAALRSQRKTRATPAQLEALVSWAKAVVGERGEVEFYFSKLPGWAMSYPLSWVETAVLCTAAKTDIRPGGLAQYTNKCLTNWHPDGPPKDMKRVAERQKASAPASGAAYRPLQSNPERYRKHQPKGDD